jgi:hypothetical protein
MGSTNCVALGSAKAAVLAKRTAPQVIPNIPKRVMITPIILFLVLKLNSKRGAVNKNVPWPQICGDKFSTAATLLF